LRVVGQFQSEHQFSLVEMKSTIHEAARRRLVLGDASCDFVDRPPPLKQKNFKMTHYLLQATLVFIPAVIV